MRVIAAKVIDPTHLELTEPLTMRSGSRVAVTVTEDDRGPTHSATAESEPAKAPRPLRFQGFGLVWR